MPQIKSGFTLKSKSPNFERDSFETKFEMKNVEVGHMDEGHISYCKEDGKHYVFSINNKYDIETGYFKIFTTETDSIPENLENRLQTLEDTINEIYGINFPVTLSFKASPSTIEYVGIDKVASLLIGITYKDTELDRNEVTSLLVTGDDTSIIDKHNIHSATVNVTLKPGSASNHNFTLSVNAKNQKQTANCTIYQRAPFFVGWSPDATPSDKLCVEASTSLITKKVSTNTNGTYTWDNVQEGSYFWVLIPNGVTKYSKITSGGFDISLTQQDNITYRGVTYKCYRNDSAIGTSGAGKWTLVFT